MSVFGGGVMGLRNFKEYAKALGIPQKDITVLKAENDPYRQDTPGNRVKAEWLMEAYEKCHDGYVFICADSIINW